LTIKPQERSMILLAENPIDGTLFEDPSSTRGALSEFYRAFNRRDLALMEANWEQSDETVMDNPLGGIKHGWTEIRSVYERIFRGAAQVQVEFFDYSLHETGDVFWAIGRERGTLSRGDMELKLVIRTSRVFRRDHGGRWQQVHHHGSIDDADLLARYQAAVG
jgi:ketosteroid isomerase-like protein